MGRCCESASDARGELHEFDSGQGRTQTDTADVFWKLRDRDNHVTEQQQKHSCFVRSCPGLSAINSWMPLSYAESDDAISCESHATLGVG